MHFFIDDGSGKKPLASSLTFPQTKQAAAIMDTIARLIPHEGVDYDVEITFKGDYNVSVSMSIIPLTEKGEWWRKYAMEMIKKHPPTIENPEMAIPEDMPPEAMPESDDKSSKGDSPNAEVVS